MSAVMRLSDKTCVCLQGPLGFPGDRESHEKRSSFSAYCHCLLLRLYIFIPLSFYHLSILIADVLPHDGRIKLSVLISTAFHHLKRRCLINWLGNQTKHKGERKAMCLFLKIQSSLYHDSPGFFLSLSFIHLCIHCRIFYMVWNNTLVITGVVKQSRITVNWG